MALMKGSALSARFDYLRKKFPRRFDAFVTTLDPETRALAVGPCLKGSWYPFACFVDLNLKADRMFGKGDLALAREMGRDAAKTNLPVLYRLFYKVGTPEYVFGKVASVWRQHHDTGDAKVLWSGAREAHFALHDFAAPHHVLCRSLEGFIAGTFEVMGIPDARVHEDRCRLSGADCCEYSIHWTALG